MRWMLTALGTLLVSLAPAAASAQAEGQPISVSQVAAAFSNAGFQVDAPIDWGWLQPQVSTLVVHDTATDRVVTVFVFPDAASAALFRGQVAYHLQTDAPDPYVLDGYGPSTWSENVGMVESTQSQLTRLAQVEAGPATGMYAVANNAADLHAPNIPVDVDFQQALRNSAVNL